MRRSLTILLILFAAAAYTPLRAQSLDAFKERLAAPVASDAAFGTAKVAVTECGDAARAVNEASRAGARLRFPGYRVCIFFDNGQDARAGAIAAKQLFEENYPGIKVTSRSRSGTASPRKRPSFSRAGCRLLSPRLSSRTKPSPLPTF